MFTRTRQYGSYGGLFIGILLIGYAAILCSQVFVVSNNDGESSFFNPRFVREIFKDSGANTASKNIQSKTTKQLHLRINKRFETGKLFCVLPEFTKLVVFNTYQFKPLYYYSNHFISSFLYACEGRSPPVIA